MPKYFVFILLTFSPVILGLDLDFKSFFVIWNVGQGQWATLVLPETCHHFDMGGEKNPLNHVRKYCGKKKNKIYLSHWDWDHISFALRARKVLKNSCLALAPLGKSSPYKMKILKAYAACDADAAPPVMELTRFSTKNLSLKTNDLSHVLIAQNKILIPGDSPKTQEKEWLTRLPTNKVRILLLGHHGSQTSTSEDLLSHLHELAVSVASARFARYGHPHQIVVQRLRRHHIPLLRTEDWGHVWFLSP